MAPTRLPWRVSRRASTATNSAETLRLRCSPEPKSTEGLRSSRNQAAISRSSVNTRTCGVCSARGDVPVDVAHVVVVLVFAQVGQVQAGAAQQRAVVALQQAVEPADHRPLQAAQHAARRCRRSGPLAGPRALRRRGRRGVLRSQLFMFQRLGRRRDLGHDLADQRVGGQAFGQRLVRQHQRGGAARRAPGRSCPRAARSCGRAAWPGRARLRSG